MIMKQIMSMIFHTCDMHAIFQGISDEFIKVYKIGIINEIDMQTRSRCHNMEQI